MKLSLESQLSVWTALVGHQCQVWQAVRMGDRMDYRRSKVNLWSHGRGEIRGACVVYGQIEVTVRFPRGGGFFQTHAYNAEQVEVLDAP